MTFKSSIRSNNADYNNIYGLCHNNDIGAGTQGANKFSNFSPTKAAKQPPPLISRVSSISSSSSGNYNITTNINYNNVMVQFPTKHIATFATAICWQLTKFTTLIS